MCTEKSEDDKFFEAIIADAKSGNRDQALALLDEFIGCTLKGQSNLASPVARYVAECLGEWRRQDCIPSAAARSFNVARPKGRSQSATDANEQILAIETYYRERLKGNSQKDSIFEAAKSMNVVDKRIFQLLEALKGGGITDLQCAALLNIGKSGRDGLRSLGIYPGKQIAN